MLCNRFFLGALLVCTCAVAQASSVTCPQTYKNHSLIIADLFYGSPLNGADLLPDRDDATFWTLPGYQANAKGDGVSLYFVCEYQDTSATIAYKIPSDAQKCSVVVNGQVKTEAKCE